MRAGGKRKREEGGKHFLCEECDLELTSEEQLAEHVKGKIHKKAKKIFECDVCVRNFTSEVDLLSHLSG